MKAPVTLSRDDWELTMKELRSQLVQLTLQKHVLEAGVGVCEEIIEGFDDGEE